MKTIAANVTPMPKTILIPLPPRRRLPAAFFGFVDEAGVEPESELDEDPDPEVEAGDGAPVDTAATEGAGGEVEAMLLLAAAIVGMTVTAASAAALAVGATSIVLSKRPALWALSTASVSSAAELSGTVERNPIMGGSTEGLVKFP